MASSRAHNHGDATGFLRGAVNLAVPFALKRATPLPERFLGAPVIDGNVSDWRFNDPAGVIVGLRRKDDSAARGDSASGFIVAA